MAWRMTCRQTRRPAPGMSRRREQVPTNGRLRQAGRTTKAPGLRKGQFPNRLHLHPHRYPVPCPDLRARPMMSPIGSRRRYPAPCPVHHPGKRTATLSGNLILAIPPGTKTRRWPAGIPNPGRTTAASSYRYRSGTTRLRRPPADRHPGHHRSQVPAGAAMHRPPRLQGWRTPMSPGR